MTAVAIKINPALAELARSASTDADRSLTGQVEHWARLGRAVEPLLAAPDIASLKKCGGDLGLLEDEAEKARVLAVLENFRKNPQHAEMAAFLRSKGPIYDLDPANPERIIKVDPDGTRTPGKFVGRAFVPDSAA